RYAAHGAGSDERADLTGAGDIVDQHAALETKAVFGLNAFGPHSERLVLIVAEEHGHRQVRAGESALFDHVADAVGRAERPGKRLNGAAVVIGKNLRLKKKPIHSLPPKGARPR